MKTQKSTRISFDAAIHQAFVVVAIVICASIGCGTTDRIPVFDSPFSLSDSLLAQKEGAIEIDESASIRGSSQNNLLEFSNGSIHAKTAGLMPGPIMTWNTTNHEVARVDGSGNVGIRNANPETELDVIGTVQMDGFKMPTLAGEGLVLTSDAQGVGSWQQLLPPKSGLSGYEIRKRVENVTVNNGQLNEIIKWTVECPPGKRVLGGGSRVSNFGGLIPNLRVIGSRPVTVDTQNGEVGAWEITWLAFFALPADVTLEAYVICAN